jgi:hypothetical protein
MIAKTPSFVGQQISYRVNNGVPNQLTQRIGEGLSSNRVVPTACSCRTSGHTDA